MSKTRNEKAPTARTVRASMSNQTTTKGDNMNSTIQAITVPFHGANLVLVEHEGQPYTPMKPIVDGMGLAWQTQLRKLRESSCRWGITKMVIPSVDPNNETSCLPLRKLMGWMMSISPNRIKNPAVKEKVVQYQNECDDVLWDYWTKGAATNPRFSTKDDRTPLKDAVNMLIGKSTNLSYSDAWRMVHQRFAIGSVKELTVEQLPAAVEYVHKIILEGKLMDPITVIDPLSIENLPDGPNRYLVYPEGKHFGIKKLGQVALVPMDHVDAIRRDMNQFMQYGTELMSRMRILHGEANLERLAKPLLR